MISPVLQEVLSGYLCSNLVLSVYLVNSVFDKEGKHMSTYGSGSQ